MTAGCSRSPGRRRPGKGTGAVASGRDRRPTPAGRAVALSVMAGKDAFAWGRRVGRAVTWRLVHRLWQGAQWAGKITADTPAGRAFASFGPGSVIGFPPGALYGQRWIELGAGTLIAAQVSLSAGMVPGQDLGDRPVLRIGDRC